MISVKMKEDLQILYPDKWEETLAAIGRLVKENAITRKSVPLSEEDSILITYGDTIRSAHDVPLAVLSRFLERHGKAFSAVHILPFYPFSSDDGFAVVDPTAVDPDLGGWDDIENIARSHDLMFDAVINHISKSSRWFRGFSQGEDAFAAFFIEERADADYSQVVRPRSTPLFHEYETVAGKKRLWTTFSVDQLDLNYQNPCVLLRVLDILIRYAKKKARFLRLDAVGFLWKETKHPCIHHENTHRLIRIMRSVLDLAVPGTFLVSETNVPHEENITYFGENADEAHLVYQFALPPLVLHAYHKHNADILHDWSASLEKVPLNKNTAFLNFLASHDGIGLRPVEGWLTDDDIDSLVAHIRQKGGLVSYRSAPGGQRTAYELNIDYFDALCEEEDTFDQGIRKFLGAHAVLLAMRGVPAVYLHSFLASGGNRALADSTGIPRRINRQKLDMETLEADLASSSSRRRVVLDNMKSLLAIRRRIDAFHPDAPQTEKWYDSRVFSFVREGKTTRVAVLVNLARKEVRLDTDLCGFDLFSGLCCERTVNLQPYGYMWLQLDND